MRLLIVEDTDAIYEYYIRHFESLLPMEMMTISRANTIEEAAKALLDDWDVVLMDYQLGQSHTVDGLNEVLRNGKDLIEFRRKNEAALYLSKEPRQKPVLILGTSSSLIFNQKLRKAGANYTHMKNEVEDIAVMLKERLRKNASEKR